jgi:hypothetical protein
VRNPGLFGEDKKGLSGFFTKAFGGLKDVENVFTQHKPLLRNIIEKIFKGKLDTKQYPFFSLTSSEM